MLQTANIVVTLELASVINVLKVIVSPNKAPVQRQDALQLQCSLSVVNAFIARHWVGLVTGSMLIVPCCHIVVDLYAVCCKLLLL